jgi:hypothetical protein
VLLAPVPSFTSLDSTARILPLELDEGNLEIPDPTGLGNADQPPRLADVFRPVATGALI